LKEQRTTAPGRPPILWTGVIFALAANLLLSTVATMLLGRLASDAAYSFWFVPVLITPLLAGYMTALYVRQRGGIHAFLGGMISVPLLGIYIFSGNWPLALFAGSFCTLGGTLTERITRK
jgi:hypothetical protein